MIPRRREDITTGATRKPTGRARPGALPRRPAPGPRRAFAGCSDSVGPADALPCRKRRGESGDRAGPAVGGTTFAWAGPACERGQPVTITPCGPHLPAGVRQRPGRRQPHPHRLARPRRRLGGGPPRRPPLPATAEQVQRRWGTGHLPVFFFFFFFFFFPGGPASPWPAQRRPSNGSRGSTFWTSTSGGPTRGGGHRRSANGAGRRAGHDVQVVHVVTGRGHRGTVPAVGHQDDVTGPDLGRHVDGTLSEP